MIIPDFKRVWYSVRFMCLSGYYLFPTPLPYLNTFDSGHFSPGWEMIAATYMNWWPARPLVAAAIARHVSFQMELAWNFLEAHHESNAKVKRFSIFWRRVYARMKKGVLTSKVRKPLSPNPNETNHVNAPCMMLQ